MGSWTVNPKPKDLWGTAKPLGPGRPPLGWLIENGALVRDDSLAGYHARGQEVRGSCYQRGCKRSCWIDIDFLVSRQMGAMAMAECKRLLKCQVMGGCWLDFREDPAEVGLPLRTLASAGDQVRIEFTCASCGYAKKVSPAAMIARLKASGQGDEGTLHTVLAAKLTKPCRCGKKAWRLRFEWREPHVPVHGGPEARTYDRRIRS